MNKDFELPRDPAARIVEAGWVRLVHTGRVTLAASEEGRFLRRDLLLVQSDRGDVYARAIEDSRRRTLEPGAYVKVSKRIPQSEASALLAMDRSREEEARRVFIECVRRCGLEMHLADVEVTHQDPRIVFYFTAPGRVDFRQLVRELATMLRSRIELRQIGVRDEARCTGGLGPCGQPLCCSTFLREFTAVTIRMAKMQGLVPNPQKVSGLCGRLMCCLAYEHEVYVEAMKSFPRIGSLVRTPKGEGKVKELMLMRGAVKVALAPGQPPEEFFLKDITVVAGAGSTQPDMDLDETPAELKGLED